MSGIIPDMETKFPHMTEEEYKKLRDLYHPKEFSKNLEIIFIFESPNNSNSYFYSGNNSSFFRNFSRSFLTTPNNVLEEFAKLGLFIVDSTYEELSGNDKKTKIKKNYDNLVRDLKNVIGDENPIIILVTQNVLDVLELALIRDGFKLVNNYRLVPYPGYSETNINNFRSIVKTIFEENNIFNS